MPRVMDWQVRLDEIPVSHARLYLVFAARVARPALVSKAKELLAREENRLAGLVKDFGLERPTTAYVDIDLGVVPKDLLPGADKAFSSFVRALAESFPITAVSLDARGKRPMTKSEGQARELRKGRAPVLRYKDAGTLAMQLTRIERKRDIDALCPTLNSAFFRHTTELARGFAAAIGNGNVLIARLVDDMDANPLDKRLETRVGDGILLGLVAIHELMGHKRKMRLAARRFLALFEGDPKMQRAYAKQISFARERAE